MIFKEVRVVVRYKDKNKRKRRISSLSKIEFDEYSIHIISRRLLTIINEGDDKKIFKEKEIPEFTEENYYQILDVAKEMRIKWYLIFNFNFQLKNIYHLKYKQRVGFFQKGAKNLIIKMNSPHDTFELELVKKKPYAWTPSQTLVKIENYIKKWKVNNKWNEHEK